MSEVTADISSRAPAGVPSTAQRGSASQPGLSSPRPQATAPALQPRDEPMLGPKAAAVSHSGTSGMWPCPAQIAQTWL